jgi:pimeloyl-ACP methyl ester carboxylesterase
MRPESGFPPGRVDGAVPKSLAFPLMLTLLAAASGCGMTRHVVHTHTAFAGEQVVAFVADGAGGFEAASESLRGAAHEAGASLHVVTVPWTHGYGRILADVLDRGHIRRKGDELAAEILQFRASHPDTPVYLVGHSAGCLVALDAAGVLPPGSVERVVLLLPAVSADYDLRPALCCAREGVDSFYSCRDVVYLGLWVRVLGTTDGRRGEDAAGRTGFRPVVCSPGDAALYARLRQYAWNPDLAVTGNLGGHYGVYSPGYLREFVLPLFSPHAAEACPAPAQLNAFRSSARLLGTAVRGSSLPSNSSEMYPR